MADDTNTAEREAVARAIWALMREHEDRCDEELEDLSRYHPVWEYADAARASLAASAGSEPVALTVYSLQWPEDVESGRINLSTMFDTEAEAKNYAERCRDPETIRVVTLYAHPSPPEGMAGWRDIATAPKDEMYRDGSNAYAEYILVWYPGAIAPIRARWWQSDSDKCNFLADGGYAVFPTVWQPMPAPPLPASEAKEL